MQDLQIETYQSSLIKKRPRRTKAEIEAIKQAIHEALSEYHPMTVRQLFYQLVSRGVIAKTEDQYSNTVIRLLSDMRRSGEVPYGYISDNTRWMRKPTTYSTLESMLRRSMQTYRRAIWDDQDAYVEIWLEKDALAGVLMEATQPWDVPLMVTRGYPSLTYIYEAAEQIICKDKPTYLYYFGDYDPTGIDIPRHVEETLKEMAPDADIYFERVAVNPDQILLYNLPTRPTKKGDSRGRDFEGESVEVDAIPPETLVEIAEQCIYQHVDDEIYEKTLQIEAMEKDTLRNIYGNLDIFN
jgi:hypothetical protein